MHIKYFVLENRQAQIQSWLPFLSSPHSKDEFCYPIPPQQGPYAQNFQAILPMKEPPQALNQQIGSPDMTIYIHLKQANRALIIIKSNQFNVSSMMTTNRLSQDKCCREAMICTQYRLGLLNSINIQDVKLQPKLCSLIIIAISMQCSHKIFKRKKATGSLYRQFNKVLYTWKTRIGQLRKF